MRDPSFAALCRARDRLREIRDRPILIDEVAREAAMSPFHFIRRFEAMFGETPHQHRINARLDRAKLLLATQEYSVTRVCMEVGFSSLGSFSDLFARRIGVPPSVYRRRVRALMTVPHVVPRELRPGCLSLMAAAFAIFEKEPHAILSDSIASSSGALAPRHRERAHANQAHQHHGRQPGQGAEVLYRDVRLREETRDSGR